MTMQGEHVVVQEVGLRDGLQIIPRIVETDIKRRWIDASYAAGLRYMEVASFVPPKLMPQMVDAEQVVAHALGLPGLTVTALVPNARGGERALASGVHRIAAPISVSQAHSLANVRKTPYDMVDEFRRIRELCDQGASATRPKLIAGLSTVFGCTYQGKVEQDDVLDIVRRVIDAGCDAITLADTTGYATPQQVSDMFAAVRTLAPDMLLIGHFHDTRGMGLANTVMALQQGVREFDACLAGLGGCPHAPGASGNVATEDLVFMLHSMGFSTGIDLEALLASRSIVEQALPEEPLYGFIARAGLPKNYIGASL